jgi:hypothetical protein
MRHSSIAVAVLALLTTAAPGVARPLTAVSPVARTIIDRGRTELGYIPRSPDNGPGVWIGLMSGQYISGTQAQLVSYCTSRGLLYKWGVARRRSAARWVISKLEPKRRLAGFVTRVHVGRWEITNRAGAKVAVAKGPDGPAAAVALLARC